MRIDTERNRATPEGVTLALRVASVPARFAAWLIDVLVMTVVIAIAGFVAALFETFGVGLFLLFLFVVHWFYAVAFEMWNDGITPGKKVIGLRVLHDDGTPVGWTASLLRNFLRFADFLPVAYGAGLVSMFLTSDFQRLGDLAAGTLVVYRDEAGRASRDVFAAAGRLAEVEPVVPPVALSRAEQRAVVDFAQRLPTWSRERAEELASLASPLTRAHGEEAVRRLAGMGRYVLGSRVGPEAQGEEAP